MTTHSTLEDLLALTADLGVGPVRDLGDLDAAAHRPRTVLSGQQAHPDHDTNPAVLLDWVTRSEPDVVDISRRLTSRH